MLLIKSPVIAVLFWLIPVIASAETLYVSASGGGATDGTSYANAFAGFSDISWGAGANQLNAGDTLYICGTIQTGFTSSGAGSDGSPITIRGDCPNGSGIIDQGIIDGNGSVSQAMNLAHSYLTVQYLEVKNATARNIAISTGVTNLIFNYCLIHSTPISATQNVRLLNADSATFNNCTIFGGSIGIQTNSTATATVRNSVIVGHTSFGLDAESTSTIDYDYCNIWANGANAWPATTGNANAAAGATLTDGGHNLSTNPDWKALGYESQPHVAQFTVSIDDIGLSAGSRTYVEAIRTTFEDRDYSLSIFITTNGADISNSTPLIATWLAAGHQIGSHSWSHVNPASPNTITVRCTDATATLTIANNTFTTTTAADGCPDLSIDLTASGFDTFSELCTHIASQTGYTCTGGTGTVGTAHTKTLADLTNQDITSATVLQFTTSRFYTDETESSRAFLVANGVTEPNVYSWPNGTNDDTGRDAAITAGYLGARGLLTSLGQSTSSLHSYALYNWYTFSLNGIDVTEVADAVEIAAFLAKVNKMGIHFYSHNAGEFASDLMDDLLDEIERHGEYIAINDYAAAIRSTHTSSSGGKIWTRTYGQNDNTRPDVQSNPLIGRGTNLGFTLDFEQKQVPVNPTLGVYEFTYPGVSGVRATGVRVPQ